MILEIQPCFEYYGHREVAGNNAQRGYWSVDNGSHLLANQAINVISSQ
jgi:hypothetical protein